MFYKPYPKAIELIEKLRVELYEWWLDGLKSHYEGFLVNNEELPDDNNGLPCHIQWMDDIEYPVLTVEFEGMLPHYDTAMRIKGKVKHMYQEAFNMADSGIPLKHKFNHAHVFILHYFPNRIIRDVDNRYTKFLIDCLRHRQYLPDDNWQHMSWTEMGLFGKKARVHMFVVETDNTADFYQNQIRKLVDESKQTMDRVVRMFGERFEGTEEEELVDLLFDYPRKKGLSNFRKTQIDESLF